MNINITKSIMNLPLETLQTILIGTIDAINKAQPGPRVRVFGPPRTSARIQARYQACESKFLKMASGDVTALELLDGVHPDIFRYTDILVVAPRLRADGIIQESRKGRKATWHLTAT